MAFATTESSPASSAYSRPMTPCSSANSPTIWVSRSALASVAALSTLAPRTGSIRFSGPGWRGQQRSPRPTWIPRWSANLQSCRGSWAVNMRYWPARIPSWQRPSTSIIFPQRQGAELPQTKPRAAADAKADVLEFFRGRFENQLISQGHPYDVVAAVLATGLQDFVRAEEKILAMETFKSHVDFQPLAVACTRGVNI